MVQFIKSLGAEIQNLLFPEDKGQFLEHKKTLLESALQIRVATIEWIEVRSDRALAIHFSVGDKMFCKEVKASSGRVSQIIAFAMEVKPQIRLWNAQPENYNYGRGA